MEHPSRKDIRDALAALEESLDNHEQTTHGCLFPYGVRIDGVAAQLVITYQEPSAYEISNLSQTIRAFLKQETAGK